MSDYESGRKLQGRHFQVLSGPFVNQVGVLQAVTEDAGEIAWPSDFDSGVIRVWFAWREIELLPGEKP